MHDAVADVRTYITRVLIAICTFDRTGLRAVVLESKVLPILVERLPSETNRDVCEEMLRLMSHCLKLRAGVSKLVEVDSCFHCCVPYLKSDSVSVRSMAAACVSRLSQFDETRIQLLQTTAVPFLIPLLNDLRPKTCREAARALMYISVNLKGCLLYTSDAADE